MSCQHQSAATSLHFIGRLIQRTAELARSGLGIGAMVAVARRHLSRTVRCGMMVMVAMITLQLT